MPGSHNGSPSQLAFQPEKQSNLVIQTQPNVGKSKFSLFTREDTDKVHNNDLKIDSISFCSTSQFSFLLVQRIVGNQLSKSIYQLLHLKQGFHCLFLLTVIHMKYFVHVCSLSLIGVKLQGTKLFHFLKFSIIEKVSVFHSSEAEHFQS